MSNLKIEVQLSQSFIDSMFDLSKQTQKKVRQFIEKFREDPKSPSINYETIANAAHPDMRSVRIDLQYRGIVLKPATGKVYTLLWVDVHDAAYDWATSHKISTQSIEGSLGVSDIKPQHITYTEEKLNLLKTTRLSDLAKMGIPLDYIDEIRQINYIAELKPYIDVLPSITVLRLQNYLNGHPLESVLAINDVKDNPFVILDDTDESELEEIIKQPSTAWRLFLHSRQTDLIQKDFKGSFKLLGAAGTGKTVVALHRFKRLSSKLPENKKMLFTTYTSTLSEDITERLNQLKVKSVGSKLIVKNLDQWVADFVKQERISRAIEFNTDHIWESVLTKAENTKYTLGFLKDEWEQVVCPQAISTPEQYFMANRANRRRRLDRTQKAEFFDVLMQYRNRLAELQIYDLESGKMSVATYIKKRYPDGLYEHIIVDEAQDMSASSFVLLRALAGPEHENDLFVVGDSRQRIYKSKISLKSCGIQIAGNTRILNLNYRTTDSIYQLAQQVIENETFDDLDGEPLKQPEVQSLMYGDEPEIRAFDDFESEILYIHDRINHLVKKGADPKDICLCSRTNALVENYCSALNKRGIQTCIVNPGHPNNIALEGVRGLTMHRIKGLEFGHIILAGLSNESLPLKKVYDTLRTEDECEEFVLHEKSLLYVAMTRSKYTLSISWFGEGSHFLVNK